jgi:hypothetical protein
MAMTAAGQTIAAGNPGEQVVAAVDRILALARTWLAWDGRPRLAEDGVRLYTPNKAIRRHADHLLDHLAQIEALLAGQPSEPDHWQARRPGPAGRTVALVYFSAYVTVTCTTRSGPFEP